MLQLYFFFSKGVEKALLYLEKEELPAHWDKALFMGLELPSADEDSQDTDLDVSKKIQLCFIQKYYNVHIIDKAYIVLLFK